MAHCEFDQPIGKLSPALDDSQVAALWISSIMSRALRRAASKGSVNVSRANSPFPILRRSLCDCDSSPRYRGRFVKSPAAVSDPPLRDAAGAIPLSPRASLR
jgi:hypothetical protein